MLGGEVKGLTAGSSAALGEDRRGRAQQVTGKFLGSWSETNRLDGY